jgi:DnaJ-class molecular chaperone
MKRINEYKKLFNVTAEIDLKELKTTYRNLIKEVHPDKFQEESEKVEAEIKSRHIIDGYHFLISIAPETKAANLEEYNKTTSESGIANLKHKGQVLEVTFNDGTTYEYFGVSPTVFQKLINSDKQFRFAKRSIFNEYLYRKSKKDVEASQPINL